MKPNFLCKILIITQLSQIFLDNLKLKRNISGNIETKTTDHIFNMGSRVTYLLYIGNFMIIVFRIINEKVYIDQ